MATSDVRDRFADLDRRRRRLEETVDQLRKDLQHWQRWEAEYEGLKEELEALSSSSSKDDMLQIAKAFESELVNDKEVKELIGYDLKSSRTTQQVCGLIIGKTKDAHRRVEEIQKTLDDTELKLAGMDTVGRPDQQNEEELPVTEILERIDDEGNVISGTISRPGDAAPQLIKALEKAGFKEEDMMDVPSSSQEAKTDSLGSAPKKEAVKETSRKEKSVSFTENTKTEGSLKQQPPKAQPSRPNHGRGPQTLADLAKGSFTSNDRVIELDEYDNVVDSTGPAFPVNESAEDAALRRKMLQYNMGEMNHIVAQLDLEEVGSDEEEDYDIELGSLSSGNDTGEEDEEEDDHGMATGSQISARYRRDMLELEKVLNMRMMENVGPGADGSPIHGPKSPTAPKKEGHVHFSEHLDIAPTPHRTPSSNSIFEVSPPVTVDVQEESQAAPTMVETVIERQAPSLSVPQPKSTTATAKKSRFKQARTQEPAAAEQPPPHRERGLLSDVIEHASSSVDPTPPSPTLDEYDAEQHEQEIRDEYHKQRTKFLAPSSSSHKNPVHLSADGTLDHDGDEEADTGIVEDSSKHAPQKRVSLFKASRLRNSDET